jgi:hypothetical protein
MLLVTRKAFTNTEYGASIKISTQKCLIPIDRKIGYRILQRNLFFFHGGSYVNKRSPNTRWLRDYFVLSAERTECCDRKDECEDEMQLQIKSRV